MQAEKQTIEIIDLGLKPYAEVWELQKTLQRKLIDGVGRQSLVICEHPNIITLGTKANRENILIDPEQLKKLGIEVVQTERGGDVTCHSPGQIVLYPILDLSLHKRDVNWYMRSLEEVIILTLADYNIIGQRISGKTGVWIETSTDVFQKIASIGVRISRWVTMHGLALNVKDSLAIFRHINPCGYKDISMTEMQELSKINLDNSSVMNSLINSFCNVFNFSR